MANNGYTPLFNEIVTSSIWNEDSAVRVVWITLMALSDMDGNVQASIAGLAPVARVTLPECEKAIQLLSSPDKYSRSQEKEGRRIEPIEGGWHLVNHRKYREKAKSRAVYFRKYREEKKKVSKKEKNDTTITTTTNSDTARNSAQQRATVALFDVFWREYPNKKGKGSARKVFERINPTEQLFSRMINAVRQQKETEQWTRDAGKYIPHPATWLNQERWDDEIEHRETTTEQVARMKREGTM